MYASNGTTRQTRLALSYLLGFEDLIIDKDVMALI
jgi:hypothetical protein